MRRILLITTVTALAMLLIAGGCGKKSTDSGDGTPNTPITVTAPNGGETLIAGHTCEITWTSSNVSGQVRIEINRDYPSGNWQILIGDKANSGSYSWPVSSPSTEAARVRITSVSDSAVSDISDGNFAIADVWTVMVYADGNNHFDGAENNTSYCIQNIQNMEKVGSTHGLNIIAMLSSIRLTGGAKYYHVEYHANESLDQISSPVLEEKGSKDMSDPATLTEFLNYCKANYPAFHYLLVIDDHGDGWHGCCLDEVNGDGGLLTPAELKNAIIGSDLERVDIITFHACQMAMVEVAYELQGCTDFVTAGQFATPMEALLGGHLWTGWLQYNLDATPSQLCHRIIEAVVDEAGIQRKAIHYAQIDLAALEPLGDRIGIFGSRLATENNGYWDEITHAWHQTHATQYDNPAHVDIGEYARNILLEPNLSQIDGIREASQDVVDAVTNAVPFTNTYFHSTGEPVPHSGLNIHFPFHVSLFDSADYTSLLFQQTNWHSFLSDFLTNRVCPTQCSNAGVITVGTVVTQCRFDSENTQHWYKITIPEGHYRFYLCDFPDGADYDLYSFLTCDHFPNNPTGCNSDQPGCENFICQITETVEMQILVNAYQGPMGGYTFLIEPVISALSEVPVLVLE